MGCGVNVLTKLRKNVKIMKIMKEVKKKTRVNQVLDKRQRELLRREVCPICGKKLEYIPYSPKYVWYYMFLGNR